MITILKKRLRLVAISVMCLILFQTCRVYKSENASFEKAAEEGKRVKLRTKDGQTLKFKKLILDSGQYYGINKSRGEMKKFPISTENVEFLKIHNKTASIVFGILNSVIVFGGIVFSIFAIDLSNSVQVGN